MPEVVLEHPEKVRRAPSRVRARGLRRGRGVHLLRPPREAAADRQGGPARADQPPGAADREGGGRRRAARCVAGNVCNTNVYEPARSRARLCAGMFEEQVGWAVDAGVDFVVGETFCWLGEALRGHRGHQAGRPAGRGHARHHQDRGCATGVPPAEACRRLRGRPAPTWSGSTARAGRPPCCPLLGGVRDAVSCHVAALPVPYRTTDGATQLPVAQGPALRLPARRAGRSRRRSTRSPATATRSPSSPGRPTPWACATSGSAAAPAPHHIRALAEALGRTPAGQPLLAPTCRKPLLSRHRPQDQGREPGVRRAALARRCGWPWRRLRLRSGT